ALARTALFAVLRTAPDTPRRSPGELSKKLRADAPLYVFPATLPIAAVGAASVAPPPRSPRWSRVRLDGLEPFGARFLLAVFGAWILVVLAGLAAFAAGTDVPAHRFLAM